MKTKLTETNFKTGAFALAATMVANVTPAQYPPASHLATRWCRWFNSRNSLEAATSAAQELIGFLVRRSSAALALACAISALLSTSSVASIFVVNSTADTHDQHPGDGACDTDGSGTCTLRAAIEEANALAGDDQIRFNTRWGGWFIYLTSALPDLSTNIEIAGPGADKLFIGADPIHQSGIRIINVTTAQTVTLSGLSISGGNLSLFGHSDVRLGGGIQNANSATLNINACTITNNRADSGGGISNNGAGVVNVINSEISFNSANQQPNNSQGGGILNYSTGTISITNSTVAQNSSANGNGSGIANASTGTVNISNSTISTTEEGFVGPAPQVLNASTGHVNVKSSIIATPSSVNVNGNILDVSGAFTSLGFNIVGIKDTSTGFTQPTDHTGTLSAPLDAGLVNPPPIASSGGPTETLPLFANSIAVNHGDPNSPPRDQRGYTRNGIPDIGAFEVGGAVPHTLANISTRGLCLTGNDVLIAGVRIRPFGQKQVILRALGPTLGKPPFNVPGALADPVLELRDSTGALVASNDNWTTAPNKQQIIASGFAPPDNHESAILTTLGGGLLPGNYTAILRGANGTTGVALLEAYDLDFTAGTQFRNISARGFVQTGNNVMIAGVVVHGPDDEQVIVRALGPTLGQPPFNLPNVLADPFLDLHDANGTLIQANNNWGNSANKQAIVDTGLAPPKAAESAILTTLSPGNYTAILSGVNSTTGNALLEVYALN